MLDVVMEKLYDLECSLIILNKNEEVIHKSFDKGIKPILNSIDFVKNSYVADKIIGKAAALLCVYGGALGVYGHIMSKEAQHILKDNNIEFKFKNSVDVIKNRQGNDMCPMEKLVLNIHSPKEAFDAIFEKVGV